MNILIISSNYPSKNNPTKGTFVHQVVKEMKNNGNNVLVISPRKFLFEKFEKKDSVFDGVDVIYPRYISFSNKYILPGLNTIRLSDLLFYRAILMLIRKIKKFKPTIIYSHFIFSSGYAAWRLSKKLFLPFIINVGESSLSSYKNRGNRLIKEIICTAKKIFTVSIQLKDEIGLLKREAGNVLYIPNGVDSSVFFHMDKEYARKKIGIVSDKMIILFVGHFIERKGPLRLIEAVKTNNLDVSLIYCGKGPQIPVDTRIIFIGSVERKELIYYYNAADIFVLPTIAEGMPNVILEAMSCGLPVITSDKPFNREFLDDECALLIDPENIEDLSQAIIVLKDNEFLRNKLIYNGKKRVEGLSLEKRVKTILREIETI